MKSLPLHAFTQYYYNSTSREAWPLFPQSAVDTYLVFSHLELCGNSRIRFLEESLYGYIGSTGEKNSCYVKMQYFEFTRALMSAPFKKLSYLG